MSDRTENGIATEIMESIMPGDVWQPDYEWVRNAIRDAARQGYRMGLAAQPKASAPPPLAVGTPVWWVEKLMDTASARTTTRRGRIINDGPTCAVAVGGMCGEGLVEFVERSRLLMAEPKEGA